MKLVRSAGMVIYYEHNKAIEYLLLHYPYGHWDFPKGHIEEGESPQEAAMRELHEETSLEVFPDDGFQEAISYIFTDEQKERVQKEVIFFVGQALDQHVALSEEHIGYTWLPFDQAYEQLTYDNAKKILKKAHDYIIAELR